MSPARGEVWSYRAASPGARQSILRLIVSAGPINRNDNLPVTLGLSVFDHDPGGLLAVHLGDLGWASALTLAPVIRTRLARRQATIDDSTMERVDAALRVCLNL